MICAETREIWKKSGAWFFKSLPKYILPDESRFKRNRSVRMSRRFRDEDSSSEDERIVMPWNRHRTNSGTESTHGNYLFYLLFNQGPVKHFLIITFIKVIILGKHNLLLVFQAFTFELRILFYYWPRNSDMY